MEQIDEKKNSEELIGLINSGTKDIFNKKEVASRLGEDVANRIKDGLEEKKDEKEETKKSVSVPVTQLFDGTLKRCLVNCKAL